MEAPKGAKLHATTGFQVAEWCRNITTPDYWNACPLATGEQINGYAEPPGLGIGARQPLTRSSTIGTICS